MPIVDYSTCLCHVLGCSFWNTQSLCHHLNPPEDSSKVLLSPFILLQTSWIFDVPSNSSGHHGHCFLHREDGSHKEGFLSGCCKGSYWRQWDEIVSEFRLYPLIGHELWEILQLLLKSPAIQSFLMTYCYSHRSSFSGL